MRLLSMLYFSALYRSQLERAGGVVHLHRVGAFVGQSVVDGGEGDPLAEIGLRRAGVGLFSGSAPEASAVDEDDQGSGFWRVSDP